MGLVHKPLGFGLIPPNFPNHRGTTGPGQRHLRRNRCSPAAHADRSRCAGNEEIHMKAHSWLKRAGVLALIVVIGLGVLGWYGTRPGPLAFVAGKTVALDGYSGHSTGVPADFGEKDIIARGRYLTNAADCEACHTTDEGSPFAGGLAFKTPFGTLFQRLLLTTYEGFARRNRSPMYASVMRQSASVPPAGSMSRR
jgi:hypothetical protein